ncbi:MAG: sigma-70 family RNA polymerase sigma factor [Clostridia bacterium]|nr:sigma-70 family RNA polymerase sigma factor [Clostridia bacterium]
MTQSLIAAQRGDKDALDELTRQNSALIYSVARRFLGRGVELDDLFQIGSIGFIKAVKGFDVTYGTRFSTYAVPKIAGEIKRFLRDDGMIKVSRSIKENASCVSNAISSYESAYGTQPRVSDICAVTGLDAEDVALCMEAPYITQSLDAEVTEGLRLMDTIDSGYEEQKLVEHIALRQAMDELDELWRVIVRLRFFGGLTQQETAKMLGINQVQVSRIERKAFEKLRKRLVTI